MSCSCTSMPAWRSNLATASPFMREASNRTRTVRSFLVKLDHLNAINFAHAVNGPQLIFSRRSLVAIDGFEVRHGLFLQDEVQDILLEYPISSI